jgi:hypothetical protein
MEATGGAVSLSNSHARAILEAWRADYNNERPHSRLGWMSPATYAAARRSATLRSADGSAPRTAATRMRMPSFHDGGLYRVCPIAALRAQFNRALAPTPSLERPISEVTSSGVIGEGS